MRQRAFDALDDLLEVAGAIERLRLEQLPVVLAADVLQRPSLARRSAFVVQRADGGTVVRKRVEQDRAGIRNHGVAVLQQDGELLEIGEARLLHRGIGL